MLNTNSLVALRTWCFPFELPRIDFSNKKCILVIVLRKINEHVSDGWWREMFSGHLHEM